MLPEAERKYWVAFSRIPAVGHVRLSLLEQAFDTLERAWAASWGELAQAGLDRRTVEAIVSRRPHIDPEAELQRLEELHIRALTWHDDDYPTLLKEIYDFPPVLYATGTLLQEDQRSVAVVGTRKATAYGREAASVLAGDLARHGVTVISGLARGIDGLAHRATLEQEWRTIAVLGCGLDIIYPPEHASLADQIRQHGALVSEYPLGTRPAAKNFPRRNRIMSGMALGTLVIEAGEHSGVRWTVHHALEQNREVFAVPGGMFSPASRGTNRLIQEGAKLVLNVMDILEELNLSALGQQLPLDLPSRPAEDSIEAQVLQHLTREPQHIDEVGRRSGLPVSAVSSTLAVMELKGLVKEVGAMHFIRTREAAPEYEAV